MYRKFFKNRYLQWVNSFCDQLIASSTTDFYQALALFTRGALMCEDMRLDGFTKGIFKVLVANQVLDEGVDVPDAKIGVVIGGQGSTRQAKQRLGRILRKSGNSHATLYEVVCENTKEVQRSRKRRKSDAYERTIHRRI